ncbi:HEPN domain protein [uncultured archaeon]|nr:HEPN domain protein [uncultured archaeon]
MKETDFFTKLCNESKLILVEPSEEMKSTYFKKSESYMVSARILLDNSRLEESVSMAYYSMYYSLQALLFKTGIKCENHSAAIILLKEVFGLNPSEISSAKKERIDKQYYVTFSVSRKDAEDLISIAQRSNSGILNFLDRLNMEEVRNFRNKAENFLNGV